MTTIARFIAELGLNSAPLSTGLASAGRTLAQFQRDAEKNFGSAGKASGSTYAREFLLAAGKGLRQTGKALTVGATLPTLAAGAFSFKAASDAAESANKFAVILGPQASGVQGRLNELHKTIPATNAQLQDMASNFAGLLQPLGFSGKAAAEMSTRLVQLTGDIVSLHNIPIEETVGRLFSGLTGESESVKRFGVDITEGALKIEAMNKGLGNNVQALTRGQKAGLIYGLMLRQTALATDDAKNTMQSASNQLRFAQRNFTELATVIGTRLLPIITPLISRFSDWLERMAKSSPKTLDLAVKIGLLGAAVGPVVYVLGTMATAVAGLISLFGGPAGLAVMATKAWGAFRLFLFTSGIEGAFAAAAVAGTGLTGVLAGLAPVAATAWAAITGPIGLAVIAIGILTAATMKLARARDEVEKTIRANINTMSGDQLGKAGQDIASRIGALQKRALDIRSGKVNLSEGGLGLGEISEEIERNMSLLNLIKDRSRKVQADQQAAALAVADANRKHADMLAAFATGLSKTADPMEELEDRVKRISAAYQFMASGQGVVNGALQEMQSVVGDVFDRLQKAGNGTDALSTKLREMAVTLRDAMTAARELGAELGDLPGVSLIGPKITTPKITPLPGSITAAGAPNKAAAFDVLYRSFTPDVVERALSGVGQGIQAMFLSALGPMALLGAVLEPLVPALQTLLVPLTMLGEILAKALLPVLRILFPVFKGVAIGATFLGEIFFRISGAIQSVFAALLIGIGKLLNKLPGSIGNPLIKAGEKMQEFADASYDAADQLKRGREELKALTFDDAVESVYKLGEAANKAANSVAGLPSWYKIEQAIFSAAQPNGMTGSRPGLNPYNMPTPPTHGFASGGLTINGGVTIEVSGTEDGKALSGRKMAETVVRELRSLSTLQFGTPDRWSEVSVV